jgi:translation initiation factor IF-2
MNLTGPQPLLNAFGPGKAQVGPGTLMQMAFQRMTKARQEQAERKAVQSQGPAAPKAPAVSADAGKSEREGQWGDAADGEGVTPPSFAMVGRLRQGRVHFVDKGATSKYGWKKIMEARKSKGRLVAAARRVVIEDGLTLRALALRMGLPVSRLWDILDDLGEEGKPDEVLDPVVAELLAQEVGMVVVRKSGALSDRLRTVPPTAEAMAAAGMPHRPPVVTVMGHVDHGKTTLLDALRGANVAEKEAGGITQGVAAFSVAMRVAPVAVGERRAPGGKAARKSVKAVGVSAEGEEGGAEEQGEEEVRSNKKEGKARAMVPAAPVTPPTPASAADVMTFIDTPGHALFASMRRRGSSVTDVVILVVDGKDGIMPQTKECAALILSSGLPCVVAITKCDLVDPVSAAERIGKELLAEGLATTDFGGEAPVVPVSAKTGFGLQDLKDAIALQAEMLDLRGDVKALGEGVVLDARIVAGQGQVVDVIATWGTLKVGSIIVAGTEMGRVKALFTDATAAASVNKRLMSGTEGASKGVGKGKGKGEPADGTVGNVFELMAVSEVGPGTPCRVLGLRGSPEAGVDLLVVESEDRAKAVLEGRQRKVKAKEMLAVAAADRVLRRSEQDAYKAIRKRRVAYDLAVTREKKRNFLVRNNLPVHTDMKLEAWEVAILADTSLAVAEEGGKKKKNPRNPLEKARQQGGQQLSGGLDFLQASAMAEGGIEGSAAAAAGTGGPKHVVFVVKADSSGALAAVKDALVRIGQQVPEVLPRVVASSVGDVSDKDVEYADEMKAHILAFNARVPSPVAKAAERRKVQLRSSRVIYHLLDEAMELMAAVLPLEAKEEVIAVAEVKVVFDMNTNKGGPNQIAGCAISEGTFGRTADVYRLVRDGKTLHEATSIKSLQVVKDKVESVAKGKECGLSLPDWADYVAGDRVLAVKRTMTKRKLVVRLD